MFDSIADLDAADAATAISEAHRELVERECRLFRLAAHWADLHAPHETVNHDAHRAEGLRDRRRRHPEVLEFAPEELGARMGTTAMAAESMMADALDVRHRLPRLWAMVHTGGVRVWRVRKVAVATRHLSLEATRSVDQAVSGSIATLSWGRFENLLEARIIVADPRLADERARQWEAERFVRAGRSRQGLKTAVVARAQAGDVLVYMATINRIAEILAERGDSDTADVRRSKAIGILAQPALALQLLWDHREDLAPSDLPVEPGRAEGEQPDEDHAEPGSPTANTQLIIQPLPGRHGLRHPGSTRSRLGRGEPRRRLRSSSPDAGTTTASQSGEVLPLQPGHLTADGPRPHDPLPQPGPRRAARTDGDSQPQVADPTRAPGQDHSGAGSDNRSRTATSGDLRAAPTSLSPLPAPQLWATASSVEVSGVRLHLPARAGRSRLRASPARDRRLTTSGTSRRRPVWSWRIEGSHDGVKPDPDLW